MSTPPSDDVACFLTSGDDTFWSEPRACRPLCRIDGPDPARGMLLITIDPPAIGQRFGRGGDDIDAVAVTPRHVGRTVRSPLDMPLDVHILLVDGDTAAICAGEFRPEDFRPVGWGTLVASREEADLKDSAMQKANGRRV